jgi:excisionase family DNA binding protein
MASRATVKKLTQRPIKRGAARQAPRQPGAPWTVRELAEVLRVSDAHIYASINEKNINAVRIGAVIRIPDPEARRVMGEDIAA